MAVTKVVMPKLSEQMETGKIIKWLKNEGDRVQSGDILAEVATGEPQGRYADVAGPETQDLVDMARRTHQVQGRKVKLVPTWSGLFGLTMAGNVLLPGENARIAPTTFDDWLAAGAR